jgi:Gram-negative bacterial TonB protein C-terminal
MKNYLTLILMITLVRISLAQEQQYSLAGKIYARETYASNIAKAIREAILTEKEDNRISLNELLLGNKSFPPTVSFMMKNVEEDPTKKKKDEVSTTDSKGVVAHQSTINIESLENTNDANIDSVYDMPEIPAMFDGGKKDMNQFLLTHIKTPTKYKEPLKGKVFVRFMVEKSGQLSKIYLVKGLSDECNLEALRVIKQMPKWQPATQNGIPVNSWQTLFINFILE